MLDPDVTIINQTEDNRVDPTTYQRTAILRVTFKVGTHGPFTERFPKDGFTQQARDQKLNDFAREVRTS